jgi:hypothetical protein
MDVYKIAVKIFARVGQVSGDPYIPIFQRWIRDQSIPGHRLIDVADYAHVVAGPGTVLVALESNFHIDHGENRLGMLYFRKLPMEGTFADRLKRCVREALLAANKLQSEPEVEGKLVFGGEEILIRLNDRLLAPANDETLAAVRPDVESLGTKLYGAAKFSVTPVLAPLAPPEIILKSTNPISVTSVLERVEK